MKFVVKPSQQEVEETIEVEVKQDTYSEVVICVRNTKKGPAYPILRFCRGKIYKIMEVSPNLGLETRNGQIVIL